MTAQITSALAEGFSADQILTYLLKQFPKHGKKIQKAIASGFSSEQVLDFLTGGMHQVNRNDSVKTEHAQIRSKDIQREKNVNKSALAGGALAAGGLIAPSLSQAGSAALQRALPSSLRDLSNLLPSAIPGTLPPQGTQPTEPNQTQTQQSNVPISSNLSPQPPNVSEILTKYNIKDKIDNLIKSGNDPKQVSAFFEKFSNAQKKAIEKESGQPLEVLIDQYVGSQTPDVGSEVSNVGSEPQELQQPSTTIAKGSLSGSPQGVGTIKELRNGQALIDIDGKLHKVNEENLIEPPMPEKDLADLYDDLISGIGEKTGEEVSRNVNWAGYDPNTNELAYRPHNGRLYIYDDISTEDVDTLQKFLTQRISTGKNFIGTWKQGTDSPIGAAMYQLIKKLQGQRGGKGQEYKNRFDTVYDALEPAVIASKEKYARLKKKKKLQA